MTAETDLLPCPFCGSPAEIDKGGFGEVFAACSKCWCHMGGAWSTTESDAIAAWNRRAIAAKDAEVEALRAEVERTNSWNERVSVCRDHVADIVDGLCVICSLHAAEERADNLQADVKSLQTLRDVVIENHGYWKGRAERLEEALRQIANQGPHYGPDGTYKTWRHWAEIARAALEQEEGGGYWPEMPKNGGPDWTGFDG